MTTNEAAGSDRLLRAQLILTVVIGVCVAPLLTFKGDNLHNGLRKQFGNRFDSGESFKVAEPVPPFQNDMDLASPPPGTLDTSFDPGDGPNNGVFVSVLQPDGKLIIGGFFTAVGATSCNRIARLNVNGSLDSSFNAGTGANSAVFAIALQSDGKIFIGGNFTSINGTTCNHLARR